MSITQKIRDKGALISAILIGLALLGFILMDAFSGRANVFGGNSTTLGKVNGKKIDAQAFSKEVATIQQNRGSGGEDATQQIIESLWNQEVNRILLDEQSDDLGITVTQKEMDDMIYGNPHPYIVQFFGFPDASQYDGARVAQYINQIRKANTEDARMQRGQVNKVLDAIKLDRMQQKFSSLLVNSINVPKWFVEKQNAENSLMSKVSYVMVPYASINDSTIKITDKEVEEYIKKHKDQYEQKEETRGINFVQFNAAASAADSVAILEELRSLKQEFATTADPQAFMQRNGSAFEYLDQYVAQDAIQVPSKDSIFSLPEGGVYGPYLDVNSQGGSSAFVVAKKVDERALPDSVRCRHILLGTQDRQGQFIMEDSVAKFKADSIAAAIRAGANFDSLEARYSTDEAAELDKGVMTFATSQIQGEGFAKEFGDFILLEGKPGDKKVVKTSFGWHYIEIMNHFGSKPHYKIAYLARSITPSTETDQAAQNEATDFAGRSKDLKSFNDNWEKTLRTKGIQNNVANNIKPNDYTVTGLGTSRNLVKMIFDADKDEVLQPEKVGESYVVAVVTEINEEGLMSVQAARSNVENVLRNKKKAEIIIKNIGKLSTLEAASKATGQPIQSIDSLRFNNSQLGFSYKVIGAAFNPDNKGKLVPQPLEEQTAVYVLRVDDMGVTPVASANVEEQRKTMQMQQKQQISSMMMYGANNPDIPTPMNSLRKGATVKDYRAKFY